MIAALIAWLRNEWRLMRLDNWSGEEMGAQSYRPCSSEDPRCQQTIERLAECRERMKRMKAGLLDGSRFTDSASTDVAATIHKARTVSYGPVRAVARRAGR